MHGINGPEDIKVIQLIEYTEESKIKGGLNIVGEITEPAEIEKFYNYYSVLKNASDKYFEALFGYKPGSDQSKVTTDPASDGEISASDAGAEPDIGPAPDEPVSISLQQAKVPLPRICLPRRRICRLFQLQKICLWILMLPLPVIHLPPPA